MRKETVLAPLREKLRKARVFSAKTYGRLSAPFEGRSNQEFVPEIRLRRRKRLSRALFHLVFAFCVSFVITRPDPGQQPIPLLTVGDASNWDITAPFTVEVEPNARSQNRREELAKRVAPVFDYDETILAVWLDNWSQTFETLRREFYAAATPEPTPDSALLEKLGVRITELTAQVLPARDILFLHQNRFNPSIQAAFDKIARRLTGRLIAPTDLFPSYYSTGIMVREMNRSLNETLIHDVSRIWSVEHAREFLNHASSIAPENERESVQRVVAIVNNVIVPNLRFNTTATQDRIAQALGNVQPAVISVKKGQIIIRKGEKVSEDKAELLRKLSDLTQPHNTRKRLAFYTLLWFALFSVLFRLSITRRALYHLSLKDAAFFMGMTLLSLVLVKYPLPLVQALLETRQILVRYGAEYILPVSMGGIIVHLMMGREAGYLFAITLSLLLGQLLDQNYFFAIWTLGTTVAAIRRIKSCKQRTDLYRAGLWSGLVGSLLLTAHCFVLSLGHQTVDWSSLGISIIFSLLSGLLAAVLTSALIPPLESLFGYTTSLKLLELSNFNHPLLHDLMMKAPGTYHHSVIVGSLAEIAADAIRANGLLARVAAYYHDIGKMGKPLYFIENQSPNDNPHDFLAPTMSAKILFSHVKNGVRMAKEHNLGGKITDIIEQHHGTTLIAYFFNKAKKSEKAELDPVSEAEFRYPGPRPKSREAAIVMLADACEAATRSISEPTASKIETMVHSIINRRFLEEQFTECDLTFSDLKVIESNFTRTLVSLYHHRIEYPGQKSHGAPAPQAAPLKVSG